MKTFGMKIIGLSLAFVSMQTASLWGSQTINDNEKEPYFILSIDGGGIKGIIPATILTMLEKDLGYKSGELFDCIAGTSTGGIIALGLSEPHPENPSKPKYGAEDLLNLYLCHGTDIFSKSWWYRVKTIGGLMGPKYDNQNLTEQLKLELGDLSIDASVTDVVIPSYDMNKGMPFFFEHFRNFPNSINSHYKYYEAALAGSAAPTFFSSEALVDHDDQHLVHNLVDGGLVANNPAEIAFRECIRYAGLKGREIYLLSIGTGDIQTAPILADDSQSWGLLQYAEPVVQSIFDASSMTVNEDMKVLSKNTNLHFFRVNVPLPQSHGNMDDASHENMLFLKEIAEIGYETYFFEGGKLDEKLLKPLRERMQRKESSK